MRLLADHPFADTIARAGHDLVRDRFCLEHMVAAVSLYEEGARASASRGSPRASPSRPGPPISGPVLGADADSRLARRSMYVTRSHSRTTPAAGSSAYGKHRRNASSVLRRAAGTAMAA